MRIPLAPAGVREMLVLTLLLGGLAVGSFFMAAAGHTWAWAFGIVFTILWAAGLAFFRDPERIIPSEADIMVSPADGVVTEVTPLEDHELIKAPAIRIGIFLSVLDVHINRSPCAGKVRSVSYSPGKFLDARHPECGRLNESNTIVMELADGAGTPIVVRQIAGLIARRIVCDVKPGDELAIGQRFGLIKFGSRTELIFPQRSGFTPAVKVGDRVFGAMTIVARRGGAAEESRTLTGATVSA